MSVIISKTRWEIIKRLSKGKKTPSELAKVLGRSIPTVHRHLKHLENLGMIERVGERKGKTRPYVEYSLGKGFVFFVEALPGEVRKRFLKIDDNLLVHLRIWSIPQKEFHRYVEGFWWELQDYLDKVEAIAVFGSVARGDARSGSDIDALILARKAVNKLEERFGAIPIGPSGKSRLIMAQVFTLEDFAQSLASDSLFAREVIENMIIIHDPNKTLEALRNGFERKAS